MHHDGTSLAALIGSRICHDLINPIGAISNGLELVGMGGTTPDGPEMSLIQQSCDNAAARIRFFRIAFGSACDDSPITPQDASKTLADHYMGTRISTEWQIATDVSRTYVQLAYLSALCLETALPQGGRVGVSLTDDVLRVAAQGDPLRTGSEFWDMLCNGAAMPDHLRPADVQFALLARLCQDAGVQPELTTDAGVARLTVPLAHIG